jgi:hypothetical protein
MIENPNSASDTFGWRLVEFALLALSAFASDFITPSQALLCALSVELLRGHDGLLRHSFLLLAITVALQSVRDDSHWWHAVVLFIVAISLRPLFKNSKSMRLVLLLFLCLNPIVTTLNATGLHAPLPAINVFELLALDENAKHAPVMVEKFACEDFAETWLPLPNTFAPFALNSDPEAREQALIFILEIVLLALLASFFNSRKLTALSLMAAIAGHFYFAPPTTIEVWMPSAAGEWVVVHIQSDGGAITRMPYSDEELPGENVAFLEQHPLRAPLREGDSDWFGMLELWSTASYPLATDDKYLFNRHIGGKRYAIDVHGYLVIAPLP